MSSGVSRNAPCPCGSGKKYKQCCLKGGGPAEKRRTRFVVIALAVLAVATAVAYFLAGRETALVVGLGGLLGLGAYLYLLSDPPSKTSGGNPGAINFGR